MLKLSRRRGCLRRMHATNVRLGDRLTLGSIHRSIEAPQRYPLHDVLELRPLGRTEVKGDGNVECTETSDGMQRSDGPGGNRLPPLPTVSRPTLSCSTGAPDGFT